MTHDYHESLPGYSPDQIWVDGCTECEDRGRRIDIGALDMFTFSRAIGRASRWIKSGLPDMSQAETPLLTVLAAITDKVYFGPRPRPGREASGPATAVTVDDVVWLCGQALREPEDVAAIDRIIAIQKAVTSGGG